jgi:lactoylglutathione lyase
MGIVFNAGAAAGLFVACLAAAPAPRPFRILGVSHAALLVSDVERSRAFYKDFLGFAEPFQLNQPDGSLSLTFIKINDLQSIELFPGLRPGQDRLHQVAFYVDNAEALRRHLAAGGVKVPERVAKGRIGNLNFTVRDPDGHTVEFVQYEADGWTARDRGKSMPEGRVSARLRHIGFLTGDVEASMRFYRDLLGFEQTWRGGRDPKQLSWINMKVPDGDDYVEFMLYRELPAPDARGTQNHLCLEVDDIGNARALLEARAGRASYGRPLEVRTGINRKRQLNLYDPDGTRVELMEPGTVDGRPAPWSGAPPPSR